MTGRTEGSRLSIVTPCYNQENFVETTLRSVLDQSNARLEYIVVDDGSTDRSSEIIERYRDQLAMVVTDKNRGFGQALNAGLRACTGEIMAWINSDDFYLPHTFRVIDEIFRDCPQVDWLVGSSLICRPDGIPESLNIVTGFAKALFFSGRYLGGHPGWSGRWIPQESVFWRRSLWERAGGYFLQERLQYGDFELWSRFWKSADLYSVSVPLAAYRIHGQTYTARRGRDSVAPCTEIIERSGMGGYTVAGMRWRNLLSRLGDRVASRVGEIAKIVKFDRGQDRWVTSSRYVM